MNAPFVASSRSHATQNRSPHDVNSHVRAWCVVHACNYTAEALHLVDGQQAAGMKPYLLAAEAYGLATSLPHRVSGTASRQPGSLLTAWNEVREWRKLLVSPDVASFELVHAHAFPAGMAAVRNCPVVVYDIHDFVECKDSAHAGHEFTWLARSFRVAEQFVIARAGAVVVHSHATLQGALERGANRASLFQIPEPLDAVSTERLRTGQACVRAPADSLNEGATFFAPDACLRNEDDPSALPADALHLLEAFAILSQEVADVRLFIQADADCVEPLYQKATALGVAGRVHAVPADDRERALAEADVVLALSGEHAGSTVITGLQNHRATLAADASAARDASPDGSGVLWFRPGDAHDLARRAVFLARNPDFRVALAEAGRRYLLETRTPDAIGRRYDAVYRHAWERRRTGPSMPGINLQPLTASF